MPMASNYIDETGPELYRRQ